MVADVCERHLTVSPDSTHDRKQFLPSEPGERNSEEIVLNLREGSSPEWSDFFLDIYLKGQCSSIHV